MSVLFLCSEGRCSERLIVFQLAKNCPLSDAKNARSQALIVVLQLVISSLFKSSRFFAHLGGQKRFLIFSGSEKVYDQGLPRIIIGMCLWALSFNLLPTKL